MFSKIGFDRKGVSPLIAWVLLIGLAVAIGIAVMNWAIDVTPEPDVDLSYCDDVSISFVSYEPDYTPGNVGFDFVLENTGYFSVDLLSIGFSYSADSSPVIWCDWLIQTSPDENGFTPGSELHFNDINLYTFGENCQESSPNGGIDNPEDILKVVVVPWINIDGETFNCNDRKLEFAVDMAQE